jgi:hypothetical protein
MGGPVLRLYVYNGVLHIGSPRHAALVSDLNGPVRTCLVDIPSTAN